MFNRFFSRFHSPNKHVRIDGSDRARLASMRVAAEQRAALKHRTILDQVRSADRVLSRDTRSRAVRHWFLRTGDYSCERVEPLVCLEKLAFAGLDPMIEAERQWNHTAPKQLETFRGGFWTDTGVHHLAIEDKTVRRIGRDREAS